MRALWIAVLLCAVAGAAAARAAAPENGDLADLFTAIDAIERQDFDKAQTLLRGMSEQGSGGAAYLLGNIYLAGQGVPADLAEAAKWYRIAAEREYVDAQVRLGMMYASGEGVGKDEAEAIKWLESAGEEPAALHSLGIVYANKGDMDGALSRLESAGRKGYAPAYTDIVNVYLTNASAAADAVTAAASATMAYAWLLAVKGFVEGEAAAYVEKALGDLEGQIIQAFGQGAGDILTNGRTRADAIGAEIKAAAAAAAP